VCVIVCICVYVCVAFVAHAYAITSTTIQPFHLAHKKRNVQQDHAALRAKRV